MTDEILKGLPCYVYRSPLGDASLGGASATHDTILVLGIEGPETIDDARALGHPIFVLDRSDPHYVRVIPWQEATPGWLMWGGNFVHACDSRFVKASKYPIPIYDRDWRKERR